MLRNLRNSCKLFAILWVLARHDALFFLKGARAGWIAAPLRLARKRGVRREGERLARAFEALGPSFIKLGQALSTRADLVGEVFARDLAGLRDNLSPFPAEKARRAVEAALGAPIGELYASFEDQPAAAASIAQVHFATLADGREVAVKILRPGIAEAFARDLAFFFWIAERIERRWPETRRMRLPDMARTLEAAVAMELDLRYEAAAAAELRENLKDDPEIYVPEMHWRYVARSVLTMERVRGVPIDRVDLLRADDHDLARIVARASASLFKQVFRDGFFHADPHPGNLFVLPDGRIAVVDFGIMGRLELKHRLFLADILRGLLTGDYARVARAHFEEGIVPPHHSEGQFALACRAIAMPILGKPLGEISLAALLGQLFQVARQFDMELQPQFLLLQKTMMLAEGVGRALHPETNMWKLAEPFIREWAEEHLSRRAALKYAAIEAGERLRRLPATLRRLDAALARLAGEG